MILQRVGIIALVIGVPSGMGEWLDEVTILGILGFIYSILVVGPTDYGVSFANLKAARGDKLEIKDMFEVETTGMLS